MHENFILETLEANLNFVTIVLCTYKVRVPQKSDEYLQSLCPEVTEKLISWT